MIYGRYLSATGVLPNSYRQYVIANNLANRKRLALRKTSPLFHKRRTEAPERGRRPARTAVGASAAGVYASPKGRGTCRETGSRRAANLEWRSRGRGISTSMDNGTDAVGRARVLLVDRSGH